MKIFDYFRFNPSIAFKARKLTNRYPEFHLNGTLIARDFDQSKANLSLIDDTIDFIVHFSYTFVMLLVRKSNYIFVNFSFSLFFTSHGYARNVYL